MTTASAAQRAPDETAPDETAPGDTQTFPEDEHMREALRRHSAGNSLGFMLWHTTLRWQRAVDSALEPLNLTHAQFALLSTTWWLGRSGAFPNQRQVAEHAGVGEVMASQILRLLERNGMILRKPSVVDTRSFALTLTPRGRELAERAVYALVTVDGEFFGDVPDPEALLDMMRMLAGRTEAGDAQERRS